MKTSVKIFSLTLLLIIFGLLVIGVVVNNQPHSLPAHRGQVDCFGTSCGPVQHVVTHDYVMVSWSPLVARSPEYYLVDELVTFSATYTIPDTPPPQFSLS